MKPLVYIRSRIFEMSQNQFALALDMHQSVISRWESGAIDARSGCRRALEPSLSDLVKIRALAAERNIPWSDAFFFEAPPEVPSKMAAA